MKTTFRISAVAAAGALAVTGCSTAGGDAVSGPGGHAGCTIRAVDIPLDTLSGTWTFSAVRTVDPRRDRTGTVLVDSPPRWRLDFGPGGPDKAAVLAAIEQKYDDVGLVTDGFSEGLAEIDSFLSQIAESTPYVGYAAVKAVTAPVTVTCAEGSKAVGSLSSWVGSAMGVVMCEAVDPTEKAPEEALLARGRFCARA
ncbi:hypothetical protein [Streptomyces sp. UG1]|uniref:hypothetical protein n=1 Tax=Streptomyces sp. UG1 TaxID=3417652 RepID=UPI003CE671E9